MSLLTFSSHIALPFTKHQPLWGSASNSLSFLLVYIYSASHPDDFCLSSTT